MTREYSNPVHVPAGAPTMCIDFGDDSFNSELLWRQLKSFSDQRLPMGCGTAPDPDLKEVRSGYATSTATNIHASNLAILSALIEISDHRVENSAIDHSIWR